MCCCYSWRTGNILSVVSTTNLGLRNVMFFSTIPLYNVMIIPDILLPQMVSTCVGGFTRNEKH